MTGKLFLLFYTFRRERAGQRLVYLVRSCLSTLLMFYNIPFYRFKGIEKDLLANKLNTPVHKLTGVPSNNATKKEF